MKKKIQRQEFKANILKRIIIRVDYKGVIDQKETIIQLNKYLKEKGFTNLDEGTINRIDLEIKDPDFDKNQMGIPTRALEKGKAYRFSNEDFQWALEINKYFMKFTIDCRKYRQFDFYNDIFTNVLIQIKNESEFFRAIRLSIRKINHCILYDLNDVNNYFDEKYYNNAILKLKNNGINTNFIKSETIDSFKFEEVNFNLTRYIDSGTLKTDFGEREAYQVILDIDGYIKGEEVLENITDSEGDINRAMFNINTKIFEIFKEHLTKEFLEELIKREIDDKKIWGVNMNE